MFIDHAKDIQEILVVLLAYVLSITPAGWFRAYVAAKLGDDTAEQMGFVSLNPVDHFDPLGFAFLVLSSMSFHFIIGWGRHVPINADNFYGSYARLRYAVAVCSDVFMYLLLATISITALIILDGIVESALLLSLRSVLFKFFYFNIFFAVISILSTVIMSIVTYLLNRFDTERYYISIFIAVAIVVILAAFLGGLLKPVFCHIAMLLGNKCAALVK